MYKVGIQSSFYQNIVLGQYLKITMFLRFLQFHDMYYNRPPSQNSNFGPLSASQRNAICMMAFRWRADIVPILRAYLAPVGTLLDPSLIPAWRFAGGQIMARFYVLTGPLLAHFEPQFDPCLGSLKVVLAGISEYIRSYIKRLYKSYEFVVIIETSLKRQRKWTAHSMQLKYLLVVTRLTNCTMAKV